MKLAPIILFVYNRKWHTEKTIEALKKNYLAPNSELFIYSDGAKTSTSLNDVNNVRKYLKTIKGFKNVTIIEKEKNLGLANSIILGVTEVINKYGKVIVLEDDLITSSCFLNFMNNALEYFENEEKVWHISGWSIPINLINDNDIYVNRVMHCWGWATWSNKWQYFDKNTNKIINQFSPSDIKRFNLDGANNFWMQMVLNRKKKLDTWAIYWYVTIFKNNGLCINPTESFVRNIGFDGSGSHTFNATYKDNKILNKKKQINFDIVVEENIFIISQIKKYYLNSKRNFLLKIYDRINILWLCKKISIKLIKSKK